MYKRQRWPWRGASNFLWDMFDYVWWVMFCDFIWNVNWEMQTRWSFPSSSLWNFKSFISSCASVHEKKTLKKFSISVSISVWLLFFCECGVLMEKTLGKVRSNVNQKMAQEVKYMLKSGQSHVSKVTSVSVRTWVCMYVEYQIRGGTSPPSGAESAVNRVKLARVPAFPFHTTNKHTYWINLWWLQNK